MCVIYGRRVISTLPEDLSFAEAHMSIIQWSIMTNMNLPLCIIPSFKEKI